MDTFRSERRAALFLCVLFGLVVCGPSCGGRTERERVGMTAARLDGGQAVVWTNIVNATATGSDLQKTGGQPETEDAGGTSQQTVASGDAAMELVVSETNTFRFIGFSHAAGWTGGAGIDFSFRLQSGRADIYENGAWVADNLGATGDVLRISITGGVASYYKNDVLVYTSSRAVQYPLGVDASLIDSGATVKSVEIAGNGLGGGSGITWGSLVNATATGSSIQKTGGQAQTEDAGGTSNEQITSGDGYFEFTMSEANTFRFVGFTHSHSWQHATAMDFSFRMQSGRADVYEAGSWVFDNTAVAGDVLRIGVTGGVASYSKNGALLYTSARTVTYPLVVDASLVDTGATIQNVVLSSGGGGGGDGGGGGGSCPTTVDYTAYAEPNVSQPAPGGSYVDPTFGNTVIRVTDGNSEHGYSYWGVFSLDKTDPGTGHVVKSLAVLRNGTPWHYWLDTQTNAVTSKGQLFATAPPAGSSCTWEDAVFSHSDPDLLYCHQVTGTTKKVYSYRLSTGVYTELHDFSSLIGSQELWQMSIDKNDDAFTFSTRASDGTKLNAIGWVKSTNYVWEHDYSDLDETHMDKNGTYLTVIRTNYAVDYWDFRNGTMVTESGETPRIGGHHCEGSGIEINENIWDVPAFLTRQLATPGSYQQLAVMKDYQGNDNWTYAVHVSLNQSDERWFISSIYGDPSNMPPPYGTGASAHWDPWEQTIVAVGTDPSAPFVKQIVHHRSYQNGDYWAQPRASISYDGKWVVYTSNWDNSASGNDVYVVKMPTVCN